MNILFFLTPKNDVAYIYDSYTVRQAIEKIRHYGYTAIPMINRHGRYIGTVTEGDLLWYLLDHHDAESKPLDKIMIKEIKRNTIHISVRAEKKVEELISLVMNQNFVPVVDDADRFIGIVTRKAIMQYCTDLLMNKQQKI